MTTIKKGTIAASGSTENWYHFFSNNQKDNLSIRRILVYYIFYPGVTAGNEGLLFRLRAIRSFLISYYNKNESKVTIFGDFASSVRVVEEEITNFSEIIPRLETRLGGVAATVRAIENCQYSIASMMTATHSGLQSMLSAVILATLIGNKDASRLGNWIDKKRVALSTSLSIQSRDIAWEFISEAFLNDIASCMNITGGAFGVRAFIVQLLLQHDKADSKSTTYCLNMVMPFVQYHGQYQQKMAAKFAFSRQTGYLLCSSLKEQYLRACAAWRNVYHSEANNRAAYTSYLVPGSAPESANDYKDLMSFYRGFKLQQDPNHDIVNFKTTVNLSMEEFGREAAKAHNIMIFPEGLPPLEYERRLQEIEVKAARIRDTGATDGRLEDNGLEERFGMPPVVQPNYHQNYGAVANTAQAPAAGGGMSLREKAELIKMIING